MERPDVIPYTWQGLTKTLKLYEEYADNLEAALARELESVDELSLANQRLEAEVERLKQEIRYPHIDCFYNGGCGCNNLRLSVEPKEAAKKAMEEG